MKQKPSKSKTIPAFVSKKTILLSIALSTVVSVLITSTGLLSLFFYINTKEDESSVSKIAYTIKSAVDSLNTEAPIASYSNTFFIDDAKLTFTKSNNVQLVYRYENYEDSDEYILLSDQKIINDSSIQMMNQPKIEGVLEKVPLFQACSRLYAVTFTDKFLAYENYVQFHSAQLKDGRTAYLWKTTDQACNAIEFYEEHLLEVIKSIDSY